MVAHLLVASSISKPQLFNWKMYLVSEETAVFIPLIIISIAVTVVMGLCTRVINPACALTAACWCSAPIVHVNGITWHPPASIIAKHQWITALVLYKLLAEQRDCGETCQLRKTRFRVFNVTWIRSWSLKSVHQRSIFTVVTYDGHANSILVSHVTGDVIRWHASFAVRINNISSTFCCRIPYL